MSDETTVVIEETQFAVSIVETDTTISVLPGFTVVIDDGETTTSIAISSSSNFIVIVENTTVEIDQAGQLTSVVEIGIAGPTGQDVPTGAIFPYACRFA